MVISVTDALPGLSGLLWEGWVGVWYMCGMRNGWPQVALCGSLTCMADRGRWLLARIYCHAGPLIFRFCCTQYNIHSGRQQRGQPAAAAEFRLRRNLDMAGWREAMVCGEFGRAAPHSAQCAQSVVLCTVSCCYTVQGCCKMLSPNTLSSL